MSARAFRLPPRHSSGVVTNDAVEWFLHRGGSPASAAEPPGTHVVYAVNCPTVPSAVQVVPDPYFT